MGAARNRKERGLSVGSWGMSWNQKWDLCTWNYREEESVKKKQPLKKKQKEERGDAKQKA